MENKFTVFPTMVMRATDETKRQCYELGRTLRKEGIKLRETDTSRLIPAEAWSLVRGYESN